MTKKVETGPAPYNRKRIAWELERTAMGDGYYGNALRAAKDFPEATPTVRSLLDRWATGKESGLSDRTDLCAFALQIYAADGESPSAPAQQPATEAQARCTCPSGDGSLRWPCPAHPAEAQPVAEVVLHDNLLYGRLSCDLPVGAKLYAAPPSAPVGAAEEMVLDAIERRAPVAPVGVEELVERMRQAPDRLWMADLVGQQISVERMRDILTFALSQQPAAVDGPLECDCGPEGSYSCPVCGSAFPSNSRQTKDEDDLNAWRADFIAERAARYREGGMATEQARIHAETDAARIDALAAQQGGES